MFPGSWEMIFVGVMELIRMELLKNNASDNGWAGLVLKNETRRKTVTDSGCRYFHIAMNPWILPSASPGSLFAGNAGVHLHLWFWYGVRSALLLIIDFGIDPVLKPRPLFHLAEEVPPMS